ncbi:Hypothetical predicted protein [Octopus vulgaris]|uniref:Uncharacterized protein n=1 Tax=Octopus vulgaris TaxID=6645 RepID=A0AA36F548_OCTVU|nr:Hypothetical predicted protein [Octopus vulgaris]
MNKTKEKGKKPKRNFDISLRIRDENGVIMELINPGVIMGLMNFVSKLDPDLENYSETNNFQRLPQRMRIRVHFLQYGNFKKLLR